MSPIAAIGAALPYDATEALLASGGSFAAALALAAMQAALSHPIDDEACPLSHAPTVALDTARPTR